MAEEFGVFTTSPTATETAAARLFRRFAPSGVVPPGSGPGSIDGGSALLVTADGTSDLTINDGYALGGGYWYRNTTPIRKPVTPNETGLTRWDRVVMRADPAADACSIEYLVGTPGSPTPPEAVRTSDGVWEEPLARFSLAPGATSVAPGAVVPERSATAASGAVYDLDGAGHDSLAPGALLWTPDMRLQVQHVDGSRRTLVDATYPTPWTLITLRGGYTRYTSGRVPVWRWVRPGEVELRGTIARSNGAALPAFDYYATLPAALRPTAIQRYAVGCDSPGGVHTCRAEVHSTGTQNPGRIFGYHSHGPRWMSLDGIAYDV